MTSMLKWNSLILFIGLILSCGGRQTTASQEQGDTLVFKYATQLSIVKYPEYTEVSLHNPWKEGSVSFWDTGNRGATTVGASNSTYGTEDGRTYANLQSKFIVIKFAAGNIFTGAYLKTDGSNGILSLGRPFTGRPTKLQFDYTYKSSIHVISVSRHMMRCVVNQIHAVFGLL